MAKAIKTTEKQPFKPFTGEEGNTFGKDNQPSPAAKSLGWQARRSERLLTQEILKNILGKEKDAEEDNLTRYVKDLIKLARSGNPKAIETINKGIEDDIQKLELSGPNGGPVNFSVMNIDPLKQDATTNE